MGLLFVLLGLLNAQVGAWLATQLFPYHVPRWTLLSMLLSLVPITLIFALGFGLVFGLVAGLIERRSVLITSRTPKEAILRSLTAALVWLGVG